MESTSDTPTLASPTLTSPSADLTESSATLQQSGTNPTSSVESGKDTDNSADAPASLPATDSVVNDKDADSAADASAPLAAADSFGTVEVADSAADAPAALPGIYSFGSVQDANSAANAPFSLPGIETFPSIQDSDNAANASAGLLATAPSVTSGIEDEDDAAMALWGVKIPLDRRGLINSGSYYFGDPREMGPGAVRPMRLSESFRRPNDPIEAIIDKDERDGMDRGIVDALRLRHRFKCYRFNILMYEKEATEAKKNVAALVNRTTFPSFQEFHRLRKLAIDRGEDPVKSMLADAEIKVVAPQEPTPERTPESTPERTPGFPLNAATVMHPTTLGPDLPQETVHWFTPEPAQGPAGLKRALDEEDDGAADGAAQHVAQRRRMSI